MAPQFTSAVTDLHQAGPVVDLHLGIAPELEAMLKASGASIPPAIPIAMMIDTGASNTVIQEGLAQQLGINPVGTTLVNTPSSENVECGLYPVRLVFPNNVSGRVTALEAPLRGQTIKGLIGRDLLRLGILIYHGPENQFTLSF